MLTSQQSHQGLPSWVLKHGLWLASTLTRIVLRQPLRPRQECHGLEWHEWGRRACKCQQEVGIRQYS